MLSYFQARIPCSYRRYFGRPAEAARAALAAVRDRFGDEALRSVTFNGSHGREIAARLDAPWEPETVAQIVGTVQVAPGARTILAIGGQDAALFALAWEGGDWRLEHFAMNGPCASGTGSFIDQQAERLAATLIAPSAQADQGRLEAVLAAFVREGLASGKPAPVACRCTVFTKSDMIHLQNKGEPLGNIVAGLHAGNAANFVSTIVGTRALAAPLVFIGGVASNPLQVAAFRRHYPGLAVPPHHASLGAAGAAALFGAYFLASVILRDKIAAFFAALLFSVDAWVLRSSASGLGVSLALVFVTVTLYYGFRREYALASFTNGLLVLSAPLEGLALFGLMMLDAFSFWRRTQGLPGGLIRSLAAGSAPVIPWIAYATLRSGGLTGDPNIVTFATTPGSGHAAGGELFWYVASGGVLLAVLLVGHFMAAVRSDWRLMAPSSFPLLWAVAALTLTLTLSPEAVARTWILVAPVIVIYGLLGLYYLAVFVIGLGPRSTFALLAVVVMSLAANQAVYHLKVVHLR